MSTYETFSGAVPSGNFAVPPNRRMTEEEFVAWCPDDVRAEWVDGEVIVMSPASSDHEFVFRWLGRLLDEFVEFHDLGIVLGSNSSVRLADQRRRRVPDLLFVQKSRATIVLHNHVEGAPDLAIEIVSPDSTTRDWQDKFADYQAAGVREYWVIDVSTERVEVFTLGNDKRFHRLAEVDGYIKSSVLPGFNIRSVWLWKSTRLRANDVAKELGLR